MESSPSPLIYHIDQPRSWSVTPRCIYVHGWCFPREGNSLAGIRLRTGEFCFAGALGLPRPDVSAAIPSAPNANVGFEIRGVLPPGRNEIIIEAQLADGSWHRLAAHTVQTRRKSPLWLFNASCSKLMAIQLPTLMKHPPKALRHEKFPAPNSSDARRPKFSVVTPSYQQARFLTETVRSVLEQTGFPCEYVVQDGGSTDGSTDILQRYATPADRTGTALKPSEPSRGITHWESIADEGQADAIIRGFAKTSGAPDDVMAWINSDDFYLPGALAFVADYFAAHPEVDVVYGHRVLIDEDSHEIGRWFLPKHDNHVLQLNDFVPQETLFWRRKIWDQVGGLDKAFTFAMDWDLLLRFQAAGARIVRLPYFLACFRIHPVQKTSAAMHHGGQGEIDRLRERTHGRPFLPAELEQSPRLLRYLRKSAWIEFLWKLGIRAR